MVRHYHDSRDVRYYDLCLLNVLDRDYQDIKKHPRDYKTLYFPFLPSKKMEMDIELLIHSVSSTIEENWTKASMSL